MILILVLICLVGIVEIGGYSMRFIQEPIGHNGGDIVIMIGGDY